MQTGPVRQDPAALPVRARRAATIATDDRFVCDPLEPWSPDKGRRAVHPHAVHLGDRDYGGGESVASYHCPVCDLAFEVELSQ